MPRYRRLHPLVSLRSLSLVALPPLAVLASGAVACQAEPVETTSIGRDTPQPTATNPNLTNGGETNVNTPTDAEPPPEPILNAPLPTGTTSSDATTTMEPKIETTVNANCASTKVTATDTTVLVPADIIIAVDTSRSMVAEAAFVQAQLNGFSEQITASGIDARVVLIAVAGQEATDAGAGGGTPGGGQVGGGFGGGNPGQADISICIGAPLGSGTCPNDTNLPGYLHIDEYVDSYNALDMFVSTFEQWRGQLRPNSIKALLVVSDDDAVAPPGGGFGGGMMAAATPEAIMEKSAWFLEAFPALDPEVLANWNLNAVYAYTKDDQCLDQAGAQLAANVGEVYKSLVASTGGISGNLCEQDFQPVFDKLATQIVENAGAELVCEWEIPAAIDGQTFSTELVQVNRTSEAGAPLLLTRVLGVGDCTAGGWFFDDNYAPTRIIACETTCAEMQDDSGGGIDVAFGCEVVAGCAASGEATLDGAAAEPAGENAAPVACEWSLPKLQDNQQQLDLDNVNVRYSTANGFGVLMGKVNTPAECASAELGWHFDDEKAPTKIVACPQTCEILQAREITKVNALFGCEPKPARPRQVL